MPLKAALPGPGQGFQDKSRVGLVQHARHHGGGQGSIPDVEATSRCRLVRPVARCYCKQVDGQPQPRGPLGEQVTAGDGDQGVRLGLGGEQQAQVGAYASRFAGSDGEAQGLHCAAWSAPGSLIST
ncbi:hypothetical protein D3C73_1189490 [compost metagenome]